MLQQTVSCDICGLVRRHPSNWFVVYDLDGELRIREWNPADTLYAEARHVCGQNCLFKLIEEFLIEQTKAAGAAKAAARKQAQRGNAMHTDASQDSNSVHIAPVVDIQEYEASTGFVTPPEAPAPTPPIHKPRHAAAR
jgi:hypothetical protein